MAAPIDVNSARNMILQLGRFDAARATQLTSELTTHPEAAVRIFADAARELARYTKVGNVGFKGFDPTMVVAMRLHAVAKSGRKEGDPRAADWSTVNKQLEGIV